MATVDVINLDGKKVGSAELNESVFGAPVRKDVMHMIVKWQLASRRQGTHKTKTRSEVRGGGKKPFKQKGTGNARQGSTRSPLLEGGAVVHGTTPRDYSFKLNKKYRANGLRSALSYLVAEGKVKVVDQLTSSNGKTKDLNNQLTGLGIKKAVMVDVEKDEKFTRASKNLGKSVYYEAKAVNVYDLLKYENVLLTEKAVQALETRLKVEK